MTAGRSMLVAWPSPRSASPRSVSVSRSRSTSQRRSPCSKRRIACVGSSIRCSRRSRATRPSSSPLIADMQEAVFAAGAVRVGTVIKMDERRDLPEVHMEDKVRSVRDQLTARRRNESLAISITDSCNRKIADPVRGVVLKKIPLDDRCGWPEMWPMESRSVEESPRWPWSQSIRSPKSRFRRGLGPDPSRRAGVLVVRKRF